MEESKVIAAEGNLAQVKEIGVNEVLATGPRTNEESSEL